MQLDQLKILPAGHIHTQQQQQITAQTGELAGNRPDGMGQRKIQGTENAGQCQHEIGVPVLLEQKTESGFHGLSMAGEEHNTTWPDRRPGRAELPKLQIGAKNTTPLRPCSTSLSTPCVRSFFTVAATE